MEEIERICNKCNKLLPINKFYFRRDRNIYRRECIDCFHGHPPILEAKKKQRQYLLDNNLKECGKCKTIKSLDEFCKDKTTETKYSSLCTSCYVEKQHLYRSTKKGKVSKLIGRYNTSEDIVEKFNQISECEICGRSFDKEKKHFDHNHSTGEYRGALCRYCNIGLGHFFDNGELLLNAIKYLNKQ